MEKLGFFRFALVASNGVALVSYPQNQQLEQESLEIIAKLDQSLPISVVEKSNLVFTSQINRFAIFIVATDSSVDADSCGDFLNALKKKWVNLYGRDQLSPNEIVDNTFESYIESLISEFNSDRKEQNSTEENKNSINEEENKEDDEPIPEIKLDHGRQTPVMITEIEDPTISREKPLLARDSSQEISINHNENGELPLTFPQEHFDETLASLRLKICWQRYKCLVIILILVIIASILAILWICGGFSLSKCVKTKKE